MTDNPEWAWKRKHGPENFAIGEDDPRPSTPKESEESRQLDERHDRELEELQERHRAEYKAHRRKHGRD